MPDEGDYTTGLEGKLGVDGTWIDSKLLSEGRKAEMKTGGKSATTTVATSQAEMGGQDEGREVPFEIGLSGDQEGQGQRRTTWTRRRILTYAAAGPMPSEGLKMLVSTVMTGHDDGNHADGPFEMTTWDVSRAHFYGEARRWIYTYLPEKGKLARLCKSMYGTRDAASIWRDTWSDVLKESSMKVGTACPAFFCSCDGDLKGLCHGDDFCVVARQNQLQTHIDLKVMIGQTLQEHVWNARRSVILGRHMVRSVEGWFREGRNRVLRFLLQSLRRSQRVVSWRRLRCSGTTEAVANLWGSSRDTV